VNDVMLGNTKALPLYVWLVSLQQLTSRVCHANQDTQRLTEHILVNVIAEHPHQARQSLHPEHKSCNTHA
jgi:hypothetical protein